MSALLIFISSFYSPARSPRHFSGTSNPREPVLASVESSAFFLRDHRTGHEIIVFGDVEPDSVSLEPHNKRVWEAAAPKIAAGTLPAIFIECSYNDSVDDAYLYGHMCPRHLVAELTVLAKKVIEARETVFGERKRKRDSSEPPSEQVSPRSKRNQSGTKSGASTGIQLSRYTAASHISQTPEPAKDDLLGFGEAARADELEAPDPSTWADADPLPLVGVSIYIIHIKEHLTDGPPPGERILQELRAHGEEAHLGCEFIIPNMSEGIFI